MFFTINGLDPVTKGDWEKSIGETEDVPTFEALISFISGRFRALQTATIISVNRGLPPSGNPTKRTVRSLATGSHRR